MHTNETRCTKKRGFPVIAYPSSWFAYIYLKDYLHNLIFCIAGMRLNSWQAKYIVFKIS